MTPLPPTWNAYVASLERAHRVLAQTIRVLLPPGAKPFDTAHASELVRAAAVEVPGSLPAAAAAMDANDGAAAVAVMREALAAVYAAPRWRLLTTTPQPSAEALAGVLHAIQNRESKDRWAALAEGDRRKNNVEGRHAMIEALAILEKLRRTPAPVAEGDADAPFPAGLHASKSHNGVPCEGAVVHREPGLAVDSLGKPRE